MRRTRLRAALLIVVAAALGGIGFLVSRNVTARKARTLEDLGRDFLPEVAQRIQNFRRVKVKDGRTVWEITAADAQYYSEQDEIVVREPRLTLFFEDGRRKAHVTGAEGRLTLTGRELRTVTLRGGVDVTLDDLAVRTDEAMYDRETDLITSSALVTIRGKTLDVRARGMEVAVGPQRVRLMDDVHTVVHPDASAS
jgi:LPS export ABC transporter protein LptC